MRTRLCVLTGLVYNLNSPAGGAAEVAGKDQFMLFEMESMPRFPKSPFETMVEMLGVSEACPAWPDEFGRRLSKYAAETVSHPPRVLSLFTGAGGLDLGFHDSGFQILEMVEHDPRFIETLSRNFGPRGGFEGSKTVCRDIREYAPSKQLMADFIIGGPPCQTFSAAGRRAAGVQGLDDPRGNLFEEYVRILKAVRPKGFLFENVYGIVGAQQGRAWRAILKAFTSIGYTVSHRILDSADYGVPQNRERAFIVGLRDSPFLFPSPTHGPDSPDARPFYVAGQAIHGVQDQKPGHVGGKYGSLLDGIPPGLNYSFYTEEMGHPRPIFAWRSKFSDFLYKADPKSPVRTIKALGGQYTGPFHWSSRPFSVGELKRLQTFPDDYDICGGPVAIRQQIGNSVPPQLARLLAIAVMEQCFAQGWLSELAYLAATDRLGFRSRKRLLTVEYRRKALGAIEKFKPSKNGGGSPQPRHSNGESGSSNSSYLACLGKDFSWKGMSEQGQVDSRNVLVRILKRADMVEIFVRDPRAPSQSAVLSLDVFPTDKWTLPVGRVRLSSSEVSSTLFVAGWKAFEEFVSTSNGKADLVQLNGYYQYQPKLKCQVSKCKFELLPQKAFSFWRIVLQVVEGRGVRSLVPIQFLPVIWGIPEELVESSLLGLKEIGYEVRSSHTNSQIPSGSVLIPYAFPTLNPKSVQLHKPLFLQGRVDRTSDSNEGPTIL